MIKDFLFYDRFLKPFALFLSKVLVFFDERILDYGLSNLWLKPVWVLKKVSTLVEEHVTRHTGGFIEAACSLSRALRLIQNGQVQFYFALGLVFMGVVIISFLLVK